MVIRAYQTDAAVVHQLSIPATGGQENLEALAPLVQSLQDTSSEQVYLRSLDHYVEEKERQIEEICGENYEVGCLHAR